MEKHGRFMIYLIFIHMVKKVAVNFMADLIRVTGIKA